MTVAEKYIVDTYSSLLERLNSISKIELLEKLAKSLKKDIKSREKDFFKSFGAFDSEKSAEKMAMEIRSARKFNRKDLKL